MPTARVGLKTRRSAFSLRSRPSSRIGNKRLGGVGLALGLLLEQLRPRGTARALKKDVFALADAAAVGWTARCARWACRPRRLVGRAMTCRDNFRIALRGRSHDRPPKWNRDRGNTTRCRPDVVQSCDGDHPRADSDHCRPGGAAVRPPPCRSCLELAEQRLPRSGL
jgi:hypothetical protein